MKKKFAILGSTGSIGTNLIQLIIKKKISCQISLLTCNKNYKLLLKQCKMFKVKNAIIFDNQVYKKKKDLFIKNKIKISNKYSNTKIIYDYSMCAISGIEGIVPTLNIIKNTKIISIANKETIICAWPLIKKKLNLYKTKFIPADSEHFSIWYALQNNSYKNIEHILLTASGGPFLEKKISELKDVKLRDTINHPNWKMGKKISIDSATMMNKVFEIIEAKNIFDLKYNQLSVIIHPKSYIHSIIKFKDGMIKLIAHETDMKIPILNTLPNYVSKRITTKKIDIKKLNNLNLSKPDLRKFPLVKVLKLMPKNFSLFETLIVSTNDTLVEMYLKKRIKYNDIHKLFFKIINLENYKKYKKITNFRINDIIKLAKKVRLNLNSLGI